MTVPIHLPSPPWFVGHRGAAGSALENTLGSLHAAVAEGVDMIEVDLQLSADENPILFHDWDLRRLAGRSEIIERTSLARLQQVELPDPFGGDTLRIATLEAALAAVPHDLPLNLELKRRFHDPARVAEVLTGTLAPDRQILLSSFDWNLLLEIRRRLPDLPVAPLGRFKSRELLAMANKLGAFSVHAHRELAPQLLEDDEARQRPVVAYTVNDPAEARSLFASGAAGVFTDVPGLLRSSVEA
ncbi:MAG: glycerophosphodiester phosphodiesterase [Acidobacteriota bacterium]|nr:glycerophosphodiester phosphodiesterase [Acidobacteriota bacterium]